MAALIPEVIERPTDHSTAVREKALDALMEGVVVWFGKDWREYDRASIRRQLDDVMHPGIDGYDAAKMLDDWCPNAELVEILDGFGHDIGHAEREAVISWAKETGQKAKHVIGTVVTAKWGGDTILGPIVDIHESTAQYVIHRPTDQEGCGAVVNYEDVTI